MSLLLFYFIELKEEVLSVSNSEPNVIQENSLQGGQFKYFYFLADRFDRNYLSTYILQKKYLKLLIE